MHGLEKMDEQMIGKYGLMDRWMDKKKDGLKIMDGWMDR